MIRKDPAIWQARKPEYLPRTDGPKRHIQFNKALFKRRPVCAHTKGRDITWTPSKDCRLLNPRVCLGSVQRPEEEAGLRAQRRRRQMPNVRSLRGEPEKSPHMQNTREKSGFPLGLWDKNKIKQIEKNKQTKNNHLSEYGSRSLWNNFGLGFKFGNRNSPANTWTRTEESRR